MCTADIFMELFRKCTLHIFVRLCSSILQNAKCLFGWSEHDFYSWKEKCMEEKTCVSCCNIFC